MQQIESELPSRHYWFSWGSDEAQSEWMGMYGYECMLKLSWSNPEYKQSTKRLYRIRIIHTTIGSIKEVWSKRLVRLVQDTFRIGSALNELHWFRIASAYVPCLQVPNTSYPTQHSFQTAGKKVSFLHKFSPPTKIIFSLVERIFV